MPSSRTARALRWVQDVAQERRLSYAIVTALVAVPRLVALVADRDDILQPFTFGEKSDDIARTFVDSGTFGFIPGQPTAYTQPLYSFVLIPLYETAGRSWETVGGLQIVIAIARRPSMKANGSDLKTSHRYQRSTIPCAGGTRSCSIACRSLAAG